MAKYFIFGITSLSFLLASISATTVSVAFPDITSDFNISLILAGWVLNINQLVSTACMPLGGKAGDVFGVKNAYLFSMAIFAAGSLVCALAPNITVLIAGRFFQSIGFGSILPLGTSIVSDAFPESRQQAIGFFGSIVPLGSIIGPVIGGWLVESFGWRSTFWFNVPLALIVFFVLLKILKTGKGKGGQLDLLGTGYFTGMLFALLVALNTLGNIKDGGSWLIPVALLLVSIVLLVAFLRREGRIKNPIIEIYFLKKRPFLEANIYNLVYGAAALGVMSLLPLFAVSVYGMTTLGSGLILAPRAIGTMLAAMVTSYYLPRWGYRGPMLVGTSFVVISLALLGVKPSGFDIMGIHFNAAFLVGLFLFFAGAGCGIVAPAANNACVDLMPERIGTITGLRGMFRQSGSAISIAVTTLALHYFSDISFGFTVVYWGLALIMMITIPTVFSMPKSPGDPRWPKQSFQ